MKKSKQLVWFLLLAGFLICSFPVYGQASLSGEDTIDTIEIDGTLYTCVRDALNEKQWYYIPNSPRLVENKVNGKMTPKFTLVRFQYKEGSRFVEGGVLQFEINMALPPNVVSKLKAKVAKSIDKKASEINLGALPFSKANMHLYSPLGDLFVSATPTEGIAPNVATGSIPFSIRLEGAAAADIMSALVGKGQGGVPVVVDFEYSGITPPVAGLYATVDMKKMYSHFEKNSKSRAKVGGWFWSASVSKDSTVIREVIKDSGGVEFSILQSDDPQVQENMDSFRDWIMEQIAKDLLVLETPPPEFDPAKADEPSSGWFGGGGHSVSIRDVKQNILVDKKYSAEIRRTVTRHSSAGALIGIGTYPDDIKNELVFDTPKGVWDKVYYTMPSVSADDSVGIESVKLEIAIKTDTGLKEQEAAEYDPDFGGWTYGDDYINMMSWGLQGLMAGNEEDLKIWTKMTVIAENKYASGRDTRIFESEIPAFDGKSFVAMPTDTMYAYMIYADSLTFKEYDSDSNLTAVSITMTVKDADGKTKTGRFMVKPTSRDPFVDPIGFLVPEDAREVTATIKFVGRGVKTIWDFNGKNLIGSEYDGWLFLDDSMWQ